MSAGQFFAMKIPQWIQKAKQKNVSKLSKNPAQQQQNRTANIVSYVMLIMIIVMGFTLPAAMGVYWFVGAIVSLIQTVFTNIIFAGNKKKN
jgi:membrane protein insertase Oxa1/YidC/SpoIIIJ